MSAKSKREWRKTNSERENATRRARYAARGPSGHKGPRSGHYIPEGHELRGVSTLHDAAGNVIQEWDKSGPAPTDAKPVPPGFALRRVSVMSKASGEAVRWETYDQERAKVHGSLMSAWERVAKAWDATAKPAPVPRELDDQTLAGYVIGDHHLGLLTWWRECGESWDLEKGIEYLRAATADLVSRMPPSRSAILVNVGDFKHAQDSRQVTPGHGHKLDVDGRNAKIDDAAVALLVALIDNMLTKHEHVTVFNLPGNHDPETAAALALALRCWFRNEPRVTIADAYRTHQYYRFGNVLLGFHHGDTTPAHELPAIMAVDEREAWGETEFHHWLCGHVHHKIKDKEHPGCTVETFNILPPGDAYNVKRYRASRGMTAIIWDRDYGEVGRVTVGIERVRALLKDQKP